MSKGLVLVIEDDEWVSCLLAAAIRDAGYEVTTVGTAKAGLEAACAAPPDCILCDIDLPDNDGYWVARSLRAQTTPVSMTPFMFLSGLDDQEARLEGFNVGADAYMTKPFRVDEVIAQVDALVHMAARLRSRRDALESPAKETTAIEGDLTLMSIATVLTVLEMERRTGVVEIFEGAKRASLNVASGYAVDGVVEGATVEPLATMRAMIAWKSGRFSFSPEPARKAPAERKTIGAYLLEAVRLEDESARDELERIIASTRTPPMHSERGEAAPSSAPAKATEEELDWSSPDSVRPPPPVPSVPPPPISVAPASVAPAAVRPARRPPPPPPPRPGAPRAGSGLPPPAAIPRPAAPTLPRSASPNEGTKKR